MNTKLIDDYIKKNSAVPIQHNAKFVNPELKENTATQFNYICSGSLGYDYKIKIDINNTSISSSCTCPFKDTYTGICKHVVASLKKLKKDYHNGTLLLFGFNGETMKKENSNPFTQDQLYLKNHIIDLSKINVVKSKSYGYFDEYIIESVSQTQISVKKNSWGSERQVFDYNPKTQILKFSCTCNKQKKICTHIVEGLEEIVEIFGNSIFSPNYMNEKIASEIKNYGLTLQDDYQSIFTFELTPEGLKTTSKYKNIVNEEIDYTSIFKDETSYDALHLPTIRTKTLLEYGLGIYFEFNRKELSSIVPFQGKLNKLETDISSSIAPIDYSNLRQSFSYFDTEEDQNIILKTLQISLSKNYFIKNKKVNDLKKAIENLKSILPLWEKTYLYRYDNRNSLVRKNLEPVSIEYLPVKLFFSISESNFFYTVKAKLDIDGKKYNLNSKSLLISTPFIFLDNGMIPILDLKLATYLKVFIDKPEINYPKKTTPNFIEKIVIPLTEKFEVESLLFKKSTTKKPDDTLQKQVFLSDNAGEYISFKLAVNYPEKLVNVFSPEMLFTSEDSKGKTTYRDRNQSFEDNFIEEFRSLHPKFENQENLFYLTPEELFENYWMLHSVEKMKQMGMLVFGANELKSFKFNLHKPIISVNLKSEIDWFDIDINISFGNQKVNIKELQKAFLKKSNYVMLGDGTLGILPEQWMKKFSGYFKAGEIKKNGVQISNYQFGIIDELYAEMDNKPTFLEELYQKKMRLQNISEIETVPLPKGIKAKLRDYQHHGLNWLAFLDKNQLGGCLADDMGLGKTLQTIAFLQYLKSQKKDNPPSLIIAPTSLIFNWNAEIEKFCPSIKMLTFTGANRLENISDFKKYDVIISTYGSLLNDIEILKDMKFHYVILDESQAIKNPNSKRYKAVRLLNCYNRIALTGTPIENNTFDLYAQLNFLNPGLLGNMSHFKKQFSDAIDKEKDVDVSQLLSKIITPFMLRRTKEQVATELPEKTENIIFCEMGKEQRTVYDTFKNKYRDYLLNKIDENGVEKSQMYILEGLTKLRQICNSTALVPTEEDYGNYSVKLENLIENIKEKTGKHKILVFSQFVKMLQIIKTRLDEEKVTYEYLDGQTTMRQNNVNNFQNNADIRVFLISLKAGGTGLNLTEADYVFIIDPWWNPAVENQAIDRCYRIGQTKKVMAYRMICKDTIEEKIVSLQQKKKKVASSIISIDEEKKSFDINEVKQLFG